MKYRRLISVGIAASLMSSLTQAQETNPTQIQNPQRLSEWLNTQQLKEDAYSLGLMWQTPEELQRQKRLHSLLQEEVKVLAQSKKIKANEAKALERLIEIFQPTGRVRTFAAEAKWLEASPKGTRCYARQTRFKSHKDQTLCAS